MGRCYNPLIPAQAGIQREPMSFFVYVLASRRNGTLYIGMTDNLARRVWEHQSGAVPGFTKKYGVKTLVWYELHESRETAFQRERQLKKWNRAWKLKLIEQLNPNWRDLTVELV
jgi:putative endonuclease